MEVTVINPFRVTQTGAYTFTMSTADKLEKIDKKDIMVKQEGSTIDNAIKEIKLSEDKLSAEVTMHVPFVDQKKYEVTFGKEKDSFVASVGAPAAINIKTQTAVANKATKVEFAVLDAKGMDVTKTLDESKLSLSVTVKNGFYDDKKKEVTIFKVGDTAEAKVVYHTWTYDQKTGKENVVEGKGTITAVDKSSVTVVGIDKYTIGETVLSWDTDEMISMMPQNKSKKIFVRMKKSDGTYVDNLGKEKNNFKFSATDSATVTVNEKGSIYSYRQGLAYVKVVYLDFNVKYEYTLPVTVGAPSTPSSITLAPEYVTVNKGSVVHTPVILQVKDQYNEVWDPAKSTVKVAHLSGEKIVPENAAGDVTGIKEMSRTDKNIRLGVIAKNDTGVGTYKITFKEPGVELNKVLTVNAVEVNESIEPSYSLRPIDATEMEVTLTENSIVKDINDLKEGISFQLYETKANVITGKANKIITKYIDAAKERETYIIIDGHYKVIADKNFDLTKLPSDVIDIDADGSVFTIKPLIKDGNNVLLTLGDGTHTLTVVFYVPINSKNLSEGYKKVSLSSSFTVSNKTKPGVEEEDYIVKNKKVSAPATAKGIADVVIKAKNNAVIGPNTWTKDWFYALSSGRALWTNNHNKNVAPKETAGTLVIEAGKHYNLDTAPIPAFETEDKESGKAIQVWTLRDKRSIDVEYDTTMSGGSTTPEVGSVSLNNLTMKANGEANKTVAVLPEADWNAIKKDNAYKVYYRKTNIGAPIADNTNLVGGDFAEMTTNDFAITPIANGAFIEFAIGKVNGGQSNYVKGSNKTVKAVVAEMTIASAPDVAITANSADLTDAPGTASAEHTVTITATGLTKEILENKANWNLGTAYEFAEGPVMDSVGPNQGIVKFKVRAKQMPDKKDTGYASAEFRPTFTHVIEGSTVTAKIGATLSLEVKDTLKPVVTSAKLVGANVVVTFSEEVNLDFEPAKADVDATQVGGAGNKIAITTGVAGNEADRIGARYENKVLTVTLKSAPTDLTNLKMEIKAALTDKAAVANAATAVPAQTLDQFK